MTNFIFSELLLKEIYVVKTKQKVYTLEPILKDIFLNPEKEVEIFFICVLKSIPDK